MMKKTLLVTCPLCKGTLEVSAESGKVLQHWTSAPPSASHDLLGKLEAVRDRERRLAESEPADLARKLEEKKKSGAAAFDEKVKKARKAIDEGERPVNPLDLD